ncbi:hypothetical protein POUND7_007692, partial [Theobroma cacao]
MIKPELGGMLAGNRTGSEGIQSGRRGCRSPECYTKPDRTKKDANIMYATNEKPRGGELGLKTEERCQSEWQVDLFDCCSETCLSELQQKLKYLHCIYPCGVFSSITNVVSKGKTSREQATSDLMVYSLICGCCCYSCCMRKKLRELFNLEVWRELEARGF